MRLILPLLLVSLLLMTSLEANARGSLSGGSGYPLKRSPPRDSLDVLDEVDALPFEGERFRRGKKNEANAPITRDSLDETQEEEVAIRAKRGKKDSKKEKKDPEEDLEEEPTQEDEEEVETTTKKKGKLRKFGSWLKKKAVKAGEKVVKVAGKVVNVAGKVANVGTKVASGVVKGAKFVAGTGVKAVKGVAKMFKKKKKEEDAEE